MDNKPVNTQTRLFQAMLWVMGKINQDPFVYFDLWEIEPFPLPAKTVSQEDF